jgi:hypothetical protein
VDQLERRHLHRNLRLLYGKLAEIPTFVLGRWVFGRWFGLRRGGLALATATLVAGRRVFETEVLAGSPRGEPDGPQLAE